MKIKMLRSLAKRPDRIEGVVYDVPDDEADALLKAELAERVETPEPAKRPTK